MAILGLTTLVSWLAKAMVIVSSFPFRAFQFLFTTYFFQVLTCAWGGSLIRKHLPDLATSLSLFLISGASDSLTSTSFIVAVISSHLHSLHHRSAQTCPFFPVFFCLFSTPDIWPIDQDILCYSLTTQPKVSSFNSDSNCTIGVNISFFVKPSQHYTERSLAWSSAGWLKSVLMNLLWKKWTGYPMLSSDCRT